MAKVILLNDYMHRKGRKQTSPLLQTNPIWFSEISNGIRSLALKDQEIIYKNIKYNYYSNYIEYAQINSLVDSEYSFIDYLYEHLDLYNPFEILHGVDFSGEHSMNYLSENDWINIADLVVRLSLSYALDIAPGEFELLPLAEQYDWDYVKLDSK